MINGSPAGDGAGPEDDDASALSTTLVAPRSASALPASLRPTIALRGRETRVLVEQTSVVDPQRLGRSAGCLDAGELRAVDEALGLILGLWRSLQNHSITGEGRGEYGCLDARALAPMRCSCAQPGLTS